MVETKLSFGPYLFWLKLCVFCLLHIHSIYSHPGGGRGVWVAGDFDQIAVFISSYVSFLSAVYEQNTL